jgi:hypothetical protein
MDFLESKEPIKKSAAMQYLILSVFFAMLCFFIMLNVISTSSKDKSIKMTESIKNEFINRDLKKEITLFSDAVGPRNNEYERSFREVLSDYMNAFKYSMEYNITEYPSYYMVTIKDTSFYGPRSIPARPSAVNFLDALDKYIDTIRKHPYSKARVAIPYDEKTRDGFGHARARLIWFTENLDKNDKNISISIIPANTGNIYLYFDKNEF